MTARLFLQTTLTIDKYPKKMVLVNIKTKRIPTWLRISSRLDHATCARSVVFASTIGRSILAAVFFQRNNAVKNYMIISGIRVDGLSIASVVRTLNTMHDTSKGTHVFTMNEDCTPTK